MEIGEMRHNIYQTTNKSTRVTPFGDWVASNRRLLSQTSPASSTQKKIVEGVQKQTITENKTEKGRL